MFGRRTNRTTPATRTTRTRRSPFARRSRAAPMSTAGAGTTTTTTTTRTRRSGGRGFGGLFGRGTGRHGAKVRSDAALRGAVNNPNNTSAGRKHAQHELNRRGELAPRVRLGTRIRHALHLGGRSHRERSTAPRTY